MVHVATHLHTHTRLHTNRYAEGYEMGSSAGSNASRAALLMSLTEWQDPDGADKNPESAVGSFTKSMSKFKTVAKVVGKMVSIWRTGS